MTLYRLLTAHLLARHEWRLNDAKQPLAEEGKPSANARSWNVSSRFDFWSFICGEHS